MAAGPSSTHNQPLPNRKKELLRGGPIKYGRILNDNSSLSLGEVMVDLTKPDEVKTVVIWAAHAAWELEKLAKEGWIVLDMKNIPHTSDDDTFLHTAYTLGRFRSGR